MTSAPQNKKAPLWFARIAIAVVFVINVQCALVFLIAPERYIDSFELSGIPGIVAIQGLAVAFLMWNVTYPFVIANPLKNRTVFIIVLIQQLIGLIGESFILFGIGEGFPLLSQSILRFIIFDGTGFVVMLIAFICLFYKSARVPNDPLP